MTRSNERSRLAAAILAVALQVVATGFFLADAINDIRVNKSPSIGPYHIVELLIACSLALGVVTGFWLVQRLLAQARRRNRALAVARGAIGEIVEGRFQEWGLTPAEQEVALFALKGCDVAEIAEMRSAAAGTVRAQLSRIYAKAGVSGQAMLTGMFLEELLDARMEVEKTRTELRSLERHQA